MGRCKSLGSLKSFLWYAPQLSGASILCFHILSFLRVHSWGGYNVMAWWLQHPLFTDMAGHIFSLTIIYIQCTLFVLHILSILRTTCFLESLQKTLQGRCYSLHFVKKKLKPLTGWEICHVTTSRLTSQWTRFWIQVILLWKQNPPQNKETMFFPCSKIYFGQVT